MYEKLRNSFLMNLYDYHFSAVDIQKIIGILDKTVVDFDIQEKCTSVAPYDNFGSNEIKIFLSSKIINGCSKGTIYNYSRHLKIFFEEVCKEPKDITINDLRLFFYNYQKNRNVTMRSLDKVRNTISTFFAWLVDENYISTNPCKNIQKFKYVIKPREYLDQYELERIRKSCDTQRDKALIEFMYSTGCRVSEIVNIKTSDVNFREKTVVVLGKGNKYRTVCMSVRCIIELTDYLSSRDDDCEYLFTTLRKPHAQLSRSSIEKIVKKVEIKIASNKRITPHTFRHTFATTMLQRGASVANIQKILGHSDISTTMIYVETDMNDVKNEHSKFIT